MGKVDALGRLVGETGLEPVGEGKGCPGRVEWCEECVDGLEGRMVGNKV